MRDHCACSLPTSRFQRKRNKHFSIARHLTTLVLLRLRRAQYDLERLKMSSSDGQILSQYWQTSPVILEQAVEVDALIPDPSTLADSHKTDLPCRLLTGVEGETFTLTHGPFETFKTPKKPWTTVIHALEHLFPEYDQVRKSIQWIPSWRFEECMLSWASIDGSVGRH